jgi:uncharacterized protein YecT (DUF1311 family)
MKIFLTVIIITSFSLPLTAQIDLENPPWEIGCDSSTTQMEMNICSAEKLHIADSMLDLCYKELIDYVDSEYTSELKTLQDTTNEYGRKYLNKLINQKKAIIKSRTDFETFRNSTTDIVSYQYEGGSMEPMAANTCALNITINQIKILMNLREEIIDE